MGFWDRFAARLGYAKTALPEKPPPWLLRASAAERYSMPEAETATAQANLYLRLSWVQTAISAVARVAATAPFAVRERVGEKMLDVANHPFELLMGRPNPLQSRSELLTETISYLLVTGNYYWWLNRRNEASPPDEVWIVPAQQIKPVPDGKMFLRGYLYDPGDGGKGVLLEPWEVMHGKLFNPASWFVGASPLQALNTVARGDLAMQAWNANYFAKDNAKIPGAFAFADPINNTDWQRLQDEAKEQWGGTKRSGPMFLRGVGAGGVEWLSMALSHSDMEFLAGRTFTKEEIYGVFAPGLSSVLAVNATEANSKAGKDTFRELAVWPLLVNIAERITTDILPAYGDQFVGEFEDVRIRDRAMELAERNAAAQVQTIDELRETFYSMKPIGDERGQLLVAQVTAQSGGIQEAPPSPFDANAQDAGAAAEEDAQGEEQPDEPDESDEEAEEGRRRERKALKRWVKRHPGRDVAEFERRYLSDVDVHEATGQAGEAQPSETGETFQPAGWADYP